MIEECKKKLGNTTLKQLDCMRRFAACKDQDELDRFMDEGLIDYVSFLTPEKLRQVANKYLEAIGKKEVSDNLTAEQEDLVN